MAQKRISGNSLAAPSLATDTGAERDGETWSASETCTTRRLSRIIGDAGGQLVR
jgi:hypothetical protein